MRTMIGRRVVMGAGVLAALMAAGCTCNKGGKMASKPKGGHDATMRDEAVMMRLDQMQSEMDNRFAAVDYRLGQQQQTVSYAAPAVSTTTTAPAMTYDTSLASSYPAAPVIPPADMGYYTTPAPSTQIQTAMTTYYEQEKRPAARSRTYSDAKDSSVIRVSGVSTRDVQMALREARYNPGPVDGKMGAKTKSAIVEFQRANGLKADGVVGRQTWNSLMAFLPAGGGGAGHAMPVSYK